MQMAAPWKMSYTKIIQKHVSSTVVPSSLDMPLKQIRTVGLKQYNSVGITWKSDLIIIIKLDLLIVQLLINLRISITNLVRLPAKLNK